MLGVVASLWRRPARAPDPAGRGPRAPRRAASPRPREQPGRATVRQAAAGAPRGGPRPRAPGPGAPPSRLRTAAGQRSR